MKKKEYKKLLSIEEFLLLSDEAKKEYETNRVGCNNSKMVMLENHSIGTLHTICVICKLCHDCEDGNV